MASTSFSLSNQFITSKIAFTPPPNSQSSVRFRQPHRVSAVSATAESRPYSTTHITAQTSLYEVLGIQMGATCKEIKSAYRRLARSVHPDVNQNDEASSSSSSGDEFMRVHAAYTTLFDPEKRANYDRKLFRGRRTSTRVVSTATGFSDYTRRNWETDQCW